MLLVGFFNPLFLAFTYLLLGSNMHHSSSSSSMAAEQTTRGVAVEKLEYMKKWGFNTYKVNKTAKLPLRSSDVHVVSFFK